MDCTVLLGIGIVAFAFLSAKSTVSKQKCIAVDEEWNIVKDIEIEKTKNKEKRKDKLRYTLQRARERSIERLTRFVV